LHSSAVREEVSVSPVIGTILMVTITVVLAAVLWMLISHMVNPPEKPPEDVLLIRQGPTTQPDANHYDTFFTVIQVRSDGKYKVADLSYTLQGTSGSLLTDATFAFSDSNGDGYVTEGDAIQIIGMHDNYKGGTFKVLSSGGMIGIGTIAW